MARLLPDPAGGRNYEAPSASLPSCERIRRADALSLSDWRFQYAFGLDLLSQRRDRQSGRDRRWLDLIVAAIMAGLSISGGWQIVREARGELRSEQAIAL